MSNVFSGIFTAGKDAELRTIGQSQALSVTAANSVGFGDKQQTIWVSITRFGKGSDKLVELVKKGTQFFASGEITIREYKANDGSTKQAFQLDARTFDLVGRGGSSTPTPKPAPKATQDFDENIPF